MYYFALFAQIAKQLLTRNADFLIVIVEGIA